LTKVERKDWPLLVADFAQPATLAPVQLQKALFLIGRNLDHSKVTDGDFYEFRAYDYGPFSVAVYCDADQLEAEGFISVRRPPESPYKLYSITDAGRARAAKLRETLSPRVRAYANDVVRWTCSMNFNQLVNAIYRRYPEMKANSVFSE
jgi:hypothetical protein